MNLFTSHRTIFVAVPRTGSTSILWWLEKNFNNYFHMPMEHKTIEEAQSCVSFDLSLLDSFCFVRNPYDRAVSLAAYLHPNFQDDEATAIYETVTSSAFITQPQTRWTVGVKHVYRFESMPAAIADIQQRFGMPASNKPLVVNESAHEHYSKYIKGALKDVITARYRDDISRFNYEF